MKKQYGERDAQELDAAGGHYSRHVRAMTAECLDSKSDIAAELAHRDHLICKITDAIYSLQSVIDDNNRLVRELDELLNGEAGTAKQASLCDIVAQLRHSPDAGKMVPDGWQLVPVEPTLEMISAATRDSVGFGTRAAYQAMLAAAPKLGGE